MYWVALLGIVVFLVLYKCGGDRNYFNKMGVNQTKPWPFLGDLWITIFGIKSVYELFGYIYNLYPKSRYVGFYQFSVPTLMLRDPELIKQITIRDFDHFCQRRLIGSPEVDPLWSKSLFSLRGQEWREMRAVLSGSFSTSKIKYMFETINETAENFAQYFMKKDEYLIEVEMKDIFTRYTNDIVATSAFGLKVDSLAEPENIFYRMGKTFTNFDAPLRRLKCLAAFVMPAFMRIFKVSIFDKEAQNYFKNIIYETIHAREEKGIIRYDMLNLLLNAKHGIIEEEVEDGDIGFATEKESKHFYKSKFERTKELSNDDITSQALNFFLAGFDTISSALCFGSYELAMNPEIQEKLRKEILKTNNENNGILTYDILLKMNYMDITFREILRKWPPIAGIDRECTKPYTIEPVYPDEKPVHLKVGDLVVLPMMGLHRDPKYYPDPEKLIPERFLEENKDNFNPYAFLPFGSGPRNCIASRLAILEAKTVLFHLLLNFKIVPTERTQVPLKLSCKSFQPTAEDGFWLALQRIEKRNFDFE